ncbi:toxin-antitoxin system YwqK family antitoxin [Pseudomonas khorasanensis]|nr:toxin-antitoxin system YwqK family antitoxin [Pseudomonas khorasanensis]
MQFISWNTFNALLLAFAPSLNAETKSDHPTVILDMNPRATYLAKGPEVNGHSSMQLRGAALLTLSTPHACGSNEVYLTPESLGIPTESFRRALGEVQDLIDQKIPLILTLSACERKRAFFEKVRPCTPEECADLTNPLADDKLYLDEHLKPIGEGLALYYLQMPMPYDEEKQAWQAQIFYRDTRSLRSEHYVDREDFASAKPVLTYKAYYRNGKPRRTYQNDANGLRQGEALTYSDQGVVIKRENYLNNHLDGWQFIYHENGKVAESYNWHLGKHVDGEYLEYDENGALIGRSSYRNDVLHGPALGYHPNGQIKYETVFINGTSQGPDNSYFDNGAIKTLRNNVDGKPDGWLTTHFIDGTVKEKQFYKDGVQRSYEQWNEQGKQTLQWQWDEKHRQQGDFKQWYATGQLKEHRKYKNDKLHGASATWHENGGMASFTDYIEGAAHGPMRFFRKDGSLSYECHYQMGIKQGECVSIPTSKTKAES